MKLSTARDVLIREVDFLGFRNVGELVEDIELNPLAYPLRVMEAYKTYRELAYS